MKYNLITILGPTAVGKTGLAAQLSYMFNGEIISADSRQVYSGMDIGTGKDIRDYVVNKEKIRYHLIDIINPQNEFNLFLFVKLFIESFNDITNRKKVPFLVGGTGLYLSAILQKFNLNKANFSQDRYDKLNGLTIAELQNRLLQLNPALHNTTDLLIKDRLIKAIIISEDKDKYEMLKIPDINSLVIGVKFETNEIRRRITERLKKRLESGMIQEVEKLLTNGISYERLALFGLEYKFISLYLKGELNYNDMFQKLNSSIHKFAKRQMTWFRKMERSGVRINWLNKADFQEAVNLIKINGFKQVKYLDERK